MDPPTRTVAVYSAFDREAPVTLTEADTLDGGDVLPGFSMELRPMFALLDG